MGQQSWESPDGNRIAFFNFVDVLDHIRGRYCIIDVTGDNPRWFLDDEAFTNGRPAWRP